MKIFIKITKILLTLIMILSTIGSVILLSLNSTVLREGFMDENIFDNEFEKELTDTLKIDIGKTATSKVPEWIPEVFDSSVTSKDLLEYAKQYYGYLHDRVIKGGKIEAPKFENDALYNAILTKLSSDTQGTNAEEAAQSNYKYICDTVESKTAIVGSNVLDKIPTLHSYISRLDTIFYIFAGVSAASLAALLLIGRKDIARSLYYTMTAAFVSLALIFIPSYMFKAYDFADKLVVNISFFKVMVKNIINETLDRLMLVAGIILIFVICCLVLSIVLRLKAAARKDRAEA